MKEPLISVITSVLNCREYIIDALTSVKKQVYKNVEHIVIDGGSNDGTIDIVKDFGVDVLISEKDEGQYFGMNKGIEIAKGDIIGFLNADDFYADDFVLLDVKNAITNGYDSCYGDLVYVSRDDTSKILRFWKSGEFKDGCFKRGWMPPHPTFFVKKGLLEKYGFFDTRLKISADYEIMLRLLERYKISTYYIPRVLVKMRWGGKSNNLKNIIRKGMEDFISWKINGISVNPLIILYKPLLKLNQFCKINF
uniref:Glycosyltransferase n=1 Tax=candidate division WOR-3 bacterium TaxID=2052148 RepID=A0A7C4YCC4_UNCW3